MGVRTSCCWTDCGRRRSQKTSVKQNSPPGASALLGNGRIGVQSGRRQEGTPSCEGRVANRAGGNSPVHLSQDSGFVWGREAEAVADHNIKGLGQDSSIIWTLDVA